MLDGFGEIDFPYHSFFFFSCRSTCMACRHSTSLRARLASLDQTLPRQRGEARCDESRGTRRKKAEKKGKIRVLNPSSYNLRLFFQSRFCPVPIGGREENVSIATLSPASPDLK